MLMRMYKWRQAQYHPPASAVSTVRVLQPLARASSQRSALPCASLDTASSSSESISLHPSVTNTPSTGTCSSKCYCNDCTVLYTAIDSRESPSSFGVSMPPLPLPSNPMSCPSSPRSLSLSSSVGQVTRFALPKSG